MSCVMHTCTQACNHNKKPSEEQNVLREAKEMYGHSSWPIPPHRNSWGKVNEPVSDVKLPISTDCSTCSCTRTVLCVRMQFLYVSDPKASSVNHMFTN